MGVEFHYPTKAGATTSWLPSTEPSYGLEEDVDYPDQVVIKTGDGSIYVQDQGSSEETFRLFFKGITTASRDSFKTFFTTVAKSLNTFEYEDRYGTLHTVRIMSKFNFKETFYTADSSGWFEGSIELRKE
jgi:hypothetical protein